MCSDSVRRDILALDDAVHFWAAVRIVAASRALVGVALLNVVHVMHHVWQLDVFLLVGLMRRRRRRVYVARAAASASAIPVQFAVFSRLLSRYTVQSKPGHWWTLSVSFSVSKRALRRRTHFSTLDTLALLKSVLVGSGVVVVVAMMNGVVDRLPCLLRERWLFALRVGGGRVLTPCPAKPSK